MDTRDEPTQAMPAWARGGAGKWIGLSMALFFGVWIPVGGVSAVKAASSTWAAVLIGAGYLAYFLSYVTLPGGLWTASVRAKAIMTGWMLGLCTVLVLTAGTAKIALYVYALGVAGIALPIRLAVRVCAVTLVAITVGLWLSRASDDDWSSLITLISVAVVCTMINMLHRANDDLVAAHNKIADLAVAEERSRFARDLHDVLGHSLTTITLKAALARRLLQSGDTSDRAIAELADLESLSRQALAEVRSTVSGYRKASLPAEIAGARAALAAAGINADLPQAVDDVPVAYQEAFAYTLREGVTNVMRHSTATTCQVRLGKSWLEVRDDGAVNTGSTAGNGLSGLAERLAAVGGTIEAGPLPDGGFRLRATVAEPA